MRFKKPIIAVTTAVAMVSLAACGGSGGNGDNGNGNSSDNETNTITNTGAAGQGQDPTRKPPATIDGAQKGGTVKVISVSGLNTMDPTEAYYTNTASILSGLVTRSLTQYVYDAKSGDMVLVPDLATDLGTPNDDFTEWKFTLRDGIKWENGKTVTPEDIKYGIERSFDRSTFPDGAAYSNDFFLDGDTYKGPFKSKEDYKGVTIDGQTLTIKMAKPFADMPYWGAFPAMGPIPKGADDPAKYRLHPMSTGPYMFDQYTPEKTLTLKRNPNWDPDTDPGRTAYPDSYDFNFQTPSTKIDQIMLNDSGDAKNTLSYDDVLAANYRTFKAKYSDRLVLGGAPCTYYWAPDNRTVTDIDVRKALAWAYPYKAAYLAGGDITGVTKIPGTNLMPPGTPGRTEFNPLPGHEPGSTDTDKAKDLLKKADKMGFEVKFLFATDDPSSVNVKDVIVRSLKAAGFTPKPVATTVADLSTVRADKDSKINIRSAGWCSDWPSGGSWFPPVIQSTNLKEEGLGNNYAVFNNPAVDKRIDEIQRMDTKDQPAAWNDLDKQVMTDDFPMFVTSYVGVAQSHGSSVEGHYDDSVFGMPTWKNVWLKQ